MISPQGPHQKYLQDFAARVDEDASPARLAPRGSTVMWVIRAVAVVAVTILSCAGLAGVMQSIAMQCYEIGHRACFSLVVDDLTGKHPPVRRGD